MPNARVENTVPNTRADSSRPNVRVSAFQTGVLTQAVTGTTIPAGSPIGLLLALTYASAISMNASSIVYRGDQRPNARIRTT